jgi:beta-hydroxylase
MEKQERFGSARRRFLIRAGGKILKALERLIAKYSLIGDKTFFDPQQFAWTAELEANWRVMRKDLEEILKYHEVLPNFQDISIDQARLSQDDKWKTFFLYAFGLRSEKNCARCPGTTRLIEKVPGMKTAFFSILAPHKHIPEHRGPFKGVLRYHLGLIVPEPRTACRIRVGSDIAHWEEGKSLVFDDTYYHEVWNDTEGMRAVLFMDVARPLRFPVSLLNKFIIWAVSLSAYVQDAKKREEEWEKRFDQIVVNS